ncbi:MAG: PAS domain S-box protein [Syntrophaceae bacterium]|nr:PAS domain S-box protein [Syntrophaceae bacterium]
MLMAPTDRILIYKLIGIIVTVLICTFIIIPLIINLKTVRSAQLVRESEEKYRRFFSTSRDCVFITSKDGSWIDLNEAAVEIFGYSSREELMQVKISDLYADPEERAKHLSIITEQGYTKEFPVDLLRKDGTVIHTLITSVVRHDVKSNVTGFQGTIRDISDRKRAEEEQLHREKLQVVLEMAGAICHEMNQPMQIISGLSEVLSTNIAENDPIKGKLETISMQIDRMANITKKLMAIKNYETQDYAGFSRIVDINKISGT